MGDAVQPVVKRLRVSNAFRLADQDEEGGLKRVFGVVVIAQETAAYAPDHRAVPPHEGRKSRPVSAADVVPQQLRIGRPSPIVERHRATEELQNLAHLAGWHLIPFLGSRYWPSTLLL